MRAAWAIRERGLDAVVVNNNPETVSTDYDACSRLYFEPLDTESVLDVLDHERALTGEPPIVVVNGTEGEPGSFKDKMLLIRSPYLILSGAALVAEAIGADEIIVGVTGNELANRSIEAAIAAVFPQRPRMLLPFIGTLWVFLVAANLLGIVPGLHSPTRDLSLTAALALLVFLSVHWYGIRSDGLRNYLRHYLSPNPVMFPFHVMSELSRTVALAVRLFGNIMSHEFVIGIVVALAGLLVPVPLMALAILIGIVQAYIFSVLATVFIGAAVGSIEKG